VERTAAIVAPPDRALHVRGNVPGRADRCSTTIVVSPAGIAQNRSDPREAHSKTCQEVFAVTLSFSPELAPGRVHDEVPLLASSARRNC